MLTRDALRWKAGEDLARQTRHEVVGIGFQVRPRGATPLEAFDPTLLWVALDNLATDPRGEFYVPPETLRAVLEHLLGLFGEGNIRAHALWHAHFALAAPSPFDIVNFPPWLSVGVVWHEPSGRTVLYDADGQWAEPAESVPYQLAASFGPTHYC